MECEGGCGVIGLASTKKIAGKHLLQALEQMKNRGNGKGGGIAAVGLDAKAFGVSVELLENDYLLTIAYLDMKCQLQVEKEFVRPIFDIDHEHEMAHIKDFKSIGLEIKPPHAVCYFVRVKKELIAAYKKQQCTLTDEAIEDEIVYQNSYKLNSTFYDADGEKQAFVLSHGKNLIVLKMVGYGQDVIRYYQLENFGAHVWIGHHRYPTRGRVWHPGGAHPFIGLNEALVHNGDFANYFSICEYLAQRNIKPLFLTDTEVAVLIFDLLYRNYGYPLEYVIEALAPTTERDFTLLPPDKQEIYRCLQKTHIHGSPDGPWFFLIAQSVARQYRLIGITDTSMLRPQVFALQKGNAVIGLSASEKQAIDATLESLAADDPDFWPVADHYWSARGGSYQDGGAFVFTVDTDSKKKPSLVCTDKFGEPIHTNPLTPAYSPDKKHVIHNMMLPELNRKALFEWATNKMASWTYQDVEAFLETLRKGDIKYAVEVLTLLIDYRYATGQLRRSSLIAMYHDCLGKCFEVIKKKATATFAHLSFGQEATPDNQSQTLVIDATDFPAQGEDSLARAIVESYAKGFNLVIIYNARGQRFIANGLRQKSDDVVIHVFGSSGDYLASGIDGATVIVHGSGQDALAQIMKNGTLVVYGDVGQTFMYGAKDGKAFVLGNAAGRALINAVGAPKVVINGTALDYLAESFMAGNPLRGGGFIIVNGLTFDEGGKIVEMDTPYPGNSLFSLASGGAIYIRDPANRLVDAQLNGGRFAKMAQEDWETVLPYLEENAEHFNIPVSRLLSYKGEALEFDQAYRKIAPMIGSALLQEGEAAWVKNKY